MSSFVEVGKEGDVEPGRVKCVRVGDRKVALFNEGGRLVALDDSCTHVGGPLSEGLCENGTVTCPWHGAQFRVADGAALTPPAHRSLRSYPVRVVSGNIEIEVRD